MGTKIQQADEAVSTLEIAFVLPVTNTELVK